MTMDEFYIYSDMARKVFDYMNQRINPLGRCYLEIQMYDYVTGMFGFIRYPNQVVLFLGSIIDQWDDKWSYVIDKRDYVGSFMSWVLAHELLHSNQLMSTVQYNRDEKYRDNIENQVEVEAYNFLIQNSYEIGKVGNFTVRARDLEVEDIEDEYEEDSGYQRVTAKQYFLQCLTNVVLREHYSENLVKVFNDNSIKEIYMTIKSPGIHNADNTEVSIIKTNGRFMEENIDSFSSIIYNAVGQYDMYQISLEIRDLYNDSKATMATVIDITVDNPLIKPMVILQN